MAHTDEERREFGRRLKALRGKRPLREIVTLLLREHDLETSTAQLSAWERGDYAPRYRGIVETLDDALGGGGQLLDALGYNATHSDLGPALSTATAEEDPAEVEWANAWFATLDPGVKRDVLRYVQLQLSIGLSAMRQQWMRDLLTAVSEVGERSGTSEVAIDLVAEQFAVAADTGKASKPAKRPRNRPSGVPEGQDEP